MSIFIPVGANTQSLDERSPLWAKTVASALVGRTDSVLWF